MPVKYHAPESELAPPPTSLGGAMGRAKREAPWTPGMITDGEADLSTMSPWCHRIGLITLKNRLRE